MECGGSGEGFRVEARIAPGFRVSGFGFRFPRSEFRVQGAGLKDAGCQFMD